MRMTIPAQVKFVDLVDTFCRSVPYVDAVEFTRFDIDRLSKALGYMNAKLTEYENGGPLTTRPNSSSPQ